MRQQLHDEGFCIIPDVLTPEELAQAREALDRAVEESRRRGIATYTDFMDPNASNVRVYNLPEFDPLFVELLRRPIALKAVTELLGQHFIVSSFTANIALPGSGSMNLHSDLAVVLPPPWIEPWAINLIWCLDDVHERNGATRYVPGSHHWRTFDDIPPDAMDRSLPFEARRGSIIVMDGRLWHTSGRNVTDDERRAMMFAYYTVDFIRPQTNHEASLSEATKARLDEDARRLLGLGPAANVRLGGELVKLKEAAGVDANRQFERSA
jgi:ectoine hydroxylase-related dioxygenase (phytanoyl-CoA dioxygenase family)